MLWGIWTYRDLTPGDDSAYFVMASRWADHLLVSPAYYPLYNVFWGSLLWFVHDAFAVSILQRVLIVLGTTALLLAVLRRLLTPGIAWALAVWWAVLPVNYDAIYEIHLFGALAGLAIALAAMRWSGLAARATVFGLLLASALLVRNEYIVATVVFGAIWLGHEIWRFRNGLRTPPRTLAAAVLIPVVAFAALIGLVSWRNANSGTVFTQLSRKHELAFCQGYADGVWASGDVRARNALGQCYAYTHPDFGRDYPSLIQATADNPAAVARHFGRNAALLPAGLEIGLFNSKYGSIGNASNPDYIPINQGSWLVLAGSIVVALLICAGVVLIWTDRRRWWDERIRGPAWGWAVLLAMASAGLYAALLTRPRPSYIFPLTILILAALGLSLVSIADRLRVPERARAIIPVAAVAAVILIPNHYREGYSNPQIGPGQPLKTAVARLDPYRGVISRDRRGLLALYPAGDVCSYVGRSNPCRDVPWNPPLAETLTPELAGREQADIRSTPVDFIYADEAAFATDPTLRSRLDGLLRQGWRRVAPASPSSWILLERQGPASGP